MDARALVGALLLLLSACRTPAFGGPVIRGSVVHVVDGDTIDVRPDVGGSRIRVRLLGIDRPESHVNEKCTREGLRGGVPCALQVPRGRAAARRTAQLLSRRTVTLEPEAVELRDRYGRFLAYVRLADGSDLGLTLLREGYCADYSSAFPHPRAARYREAAKVFSPR